MRLEENTPVRIALKEAMTPVTGKRGRPNHTWIKTICDDLKNGDIMINNKNSDEAIKTLICITEDRNKWKDLTKKLMQ